MNDFRMLNTPSNCKKLIKDGYLASKEQFGYYLVIEKGVFNATPSMHWWHGLSTPIMEYRNNELMEVLDKTKLTFLELNWIKLPKDAWWYDGTEFIGAIQLDSKKWEMHTLTISCDEDRFDIQDHEGNAFTAWEINDFDYVAIQSGGLSEEREA